ncbi:MAG: rhomboid family intramembrane serine protease [Nanoarchaeota archaeon]
MDDYVTRGDMLRARRQAKGPIKSFFTMRNITGKLLGINITLFLLQAIIGDSFTEALLLSSQNVLAEPWTVVTAMFLHGGFMHLLFNMYALMIFGSLVERKIGSKRFFWTYMISGVIASIIFAIATPAGKAVGASGAIMAVLGLVIMLMPNLQVLLFFAIPMSMRTAGIIFALIDLVGFVSGGTGIAHIAHLAGLACGLGVGYYLKRKRKEFGQRFERKGSPYRRPRQQSRYYDSEKTIELTKDDIDNYFKYGKI